LDNFTDSVLTNGTLTFLQRVRDYQTYYGAGDPTSQTLKAVIPFVVLAFLPLLIYLLPITVSDCCMGICCSKEKIKKCRKRTANFMKTQVDTTSGLHSPPNGKVTVKLRTTVGGVLSSVGPFIFFAVVSASIIEFVNYNAFPQQSLLPLAVSDLTNYAALKFFLRKDNAFVATALNLDFSKNNWSPQLSEAEFSDIGNSGILVEVVTMGPQCKTIKSFASDHFSYLSSAAEPVVSKTWYDPTTQLTKHYFLCTSSDCQVKSFFI